MKRLLTALCLLTLVNVGLKSQEVSADDLKRASDYLNKTRTALLAATKGLSDAQWNFKSAPDRWSVAQVAEHIAATEDALMGLIQEKVMKAPARSEPANLKEIDDFIMTAIADRTKKAQAPAELAPTNRFGSGQATLDHFKKSRAKTIAFLKQTKDLRQHAVDSPVGKKLDAYQWLLFIAAHSERHTKQIAEVKADPHFPQT